MRFVCVLVLNEKSIKLSYFFNLFFLFVFELGLLFSLHWWVLQRNISYVKTLFLQGIWLRVVSWIFSATFSISSSKYLFRPWDVTTTSNQLFLYSPMQLQLKCGRYELLMERFFFRSFVRLRFCSHVYLTLKTDFVNLQLTFLFV